MTKTKKSRFVIFGNWRYVMLSITKPSRFLILQILRNTKSCFFSPQNFSMLKFVTNITIRENVTFFHELLDRNKFLFFGGVCFDPQGEARWDNPTAVEESNSQALVEYGYQNALLAQSTTDPNGTAAADQSAPTEVYGKRRERRYGNAKGLANRVVTALAWWHESKDTHVRDKWQAGRLRSTHDHRGYIIMPDHTTTKKRYRWSHSYFWYYISTEG